MKSMLFQSTVFRLSDPIWLMEDAFLRFMYSNLESNRLGFLPPDSFLTLNFASVFFL